MKNYNDLVGQAIKAGFEEYQGTYKYASNDVDIIEGSIFTNILSNNPFNGEILEIYEDGSFEHYSQFYVNHPHYSPVKFQFT